MIGPTSETGKTMLASLQAAMGRGMPVDQAITYVKSMAQQGVAPLVDLYALLKQFERLKQPQMRPPQNQSLRDQLNTLEMGQGAMGPQAGAPPMEQGLGGLNAGSMQNPQFAGGGIIAFQEGGETESFTPELYTLPKTREEAAQEAIRRANEAMTPEGRARIQAERDAEMKARGLGRYAESLKMRDKYAEQLGEEAERLPEEIAALDEEAYWADVAATSEPDFLSALAKAKPKAVERKRSRREKAAAAKEKAELETILRQEAREAIERGDYEAAENIRKELKGVVETSTEAFLKGKESQQMQETMRAQADPAGLKRRQAQLMDTILDPETSEEDRTRAQEMYDTFFAGKGGRTEADRIAQDLLRSLNRRIEQAKNRLTETTVMYNAEAKAAAEKDIRDAEMEIATLLRNHPALADIMRGGAMPQGVAPQGGANPFADMTDDQIRQQLGL
jgi:hypothetical protein